MPPRDPQSPSYWMATAARATAYPPLSESGPVDVAVIGAGIVGITAAYLLKKAGRSVALIEARSAGRQITGGTTAKISSNHSLIYTDLSWRFGEDTARLYGEANEAALQLIRDLVASRGVDCDFETLPCYSYTESRAKVPLLRKEAEVAARLGLPASFVEEAPAPMPIVGAVKFENQAQFHPLKYLSSLLADIPDGRSNVYENTRVLDVEEGAPCRVVTDRGVLQASEVIVATGLPILDRGRYFTLAHPYAHPCLAALIPEAAAPRGMFVSIDRTGFTVRTQRDPAGLMVIVMGARFIVRDGNADAYYKKAEDWTRRTFGVAEIAYKWVNEDFMSVDRLPFIGPLNAASAHVWVATGLTSWGMTGGTLAAMILADRLTGVPNPYAGVFDSRRRLSALAGLRYAWANAVVGARWVAGHVIPAPSGAVADVAPGEGRVLRVDKDTVGVFRDEAGAVHAVSATCTHMGCQLAWNSVAKTWDCPCHGSRFDIGGRVLYGPAVKDLERKMLG